MKEKGILGDSLQGNLYRTPSHLVHKAHHEDC